MSILLLLAGAVLCGAAGWFGVTKMKFVDFCVLASLLIIGNTLIRMGLE